MISARKAKQLDATTMFTYSHANTALSQSERAYYLSYFIKLHGCTLHIYYFLRNADKHSFLGVLYLLCSAVYDWFSFFRFENWLQFPALFVLCFFIQVSLSGFSLAISIRELFTHASQHI